MATINVVNPVTGVRSIATVEAHETSNQIDPNLMANAPLPVQAAMPPPVTIEQKIARLIHDLQHTESDVREGVLAFFGLGRQEAATIESDVRTDVVDGEDAAIAELQPQPQPVNLVANPDSAVPSTPPGAPVDQTPTSAPTPAPAPAPAPDDQPVEQPAPAVETPATTEPAEVAPTTPTPPADDEHVAPGAQLFSDPTQTAPSDPIDDTLSGK